MDDGNEVAMIFLDLSKAYDRICHKRLLFKLKKLQVVCLSGLTYLSGRSQRVVYGGRSSEFVDIYGVRAYIGIYIYILLYIYCHYIYSLLYIYMLYIYIWLYT